MITKHQRMKIRELKDVTTELQTALDSQTAHHTLWQIAVKAGDGKQEGELRAKLHSLLDQSLDCQVRSLQLVKILS